MLEVERSDSSRVDILDREVALLDAHRRAGQRAEALDLARRRSAGRQPPCPHQLDLDRDIQARRGAAALAGRSSVRSCPSGLGGVLWACVPYVSTMRCTSLCRTTSSPPKRMKSIPS